MSWVAIPDNLSDDPRALAMPVGARWALIRAFCYASRHETDGLIATAAEEDVIGGHAAALVAAGFATRNERGIWLVDFAECNLSHEQREARREGWRKRRAAWREKKGHGVTHDERHDERHAATGTGTGTGTEQNREREEDSVPSMSTSQERAAPAPPPQRTEAQLVVTQPEPEPEPDPSTESPQDMAMRYMLTPSTRNDGGRDRVWRFYAVRYVVATQAKPTYPTRGRKQLDDLIRVHGVEEVCRRISIYFDDPPFRLRDGSRDFARFLGNFDLLASGSGNTSKHEAGDRTAEFKWNVRERIEQMNGAAPRLSAEFAKWIAPATFEDEERHAISGS